MSSKELQTTSQKFDKIKLKILEGNIKIPPFQRHFVWENVQIINLLDSIYNDYPIGSILQWETKEQLPHKRDIAGFILPDAEDEYPVNYILDGQQRLTSLFCSLHDTSQLKKTADAVESQLFEIIFDLNSKKFLQLSDANGKYIPSRLIFDNKGLYDWFNANSFNQQEQQVGIDLQSKFNNYEVPFVTIKKRTLEEVGLIFERINNTGTELSPLDLMTAWTWSSEFYLKERFDEIITELESENYSNVKDKIILQCLSGIICQSTSINKILKLDPKSVRDNMDLLFESIKLAIDHLKSSYNILTDTFLPRSHVLVPLVYLYSKKKRLSANEKQYIDKWFWRVAFSNRYSAGTDVQLDEDIKQFNSLINTGTLDLTIYKTNITEDSLRKQKFLKGNPVTKSFLLLLANQNPLDLTNGENIRIDDALSSYKRKEYHHIFPDAFLKTKNHAIDKINQIPNFCLLPSLSNKAISKKPPSDYFKNIITSDPNLRKKIFEANLLPTDESIYINDNYEEFTRQRSVLICSKIKALTA